jgi:hypothetical protein
MKLSVYMLLGLLILLLLLLPERRRKVKTYRNRYAL